MKFQFSIRSLLIVVTVSALGVVVWSWWLRSPARTAEQFVCLVHEGNFDLANQMMVPPARITTVSGKGLPSYAATGNVYFILNDGKSFSMDPRLVKRLFAKLKAFPISGKLKNGTCRFQANVLAFDVQDGKIVGMLDMQAEPDVEIGHYRDKQ